MKKINLLIPMAGKGSRFIENGCFLPKPLIVAGEKQILDWSMESVDFSNCNLIFVVRNEHICNYAIDKILKDKYGDVQIIKTYGDTRGSVESCLYAKDLINNDSPLVVYCLDVNFKPKFNPSLVPEDKDGWILTFKSNSPNYSYSEIENDLVKRVAEKSVISNNANVGIYYFKKGNNFVECAEEMLNKNMLTNNEFYVAPLYNIMIEKNQKIGHEEVDKMHVMGTPRELEFFVKNSLNKIQNNTIALCCDHSGFELKEYCKKYLSSLGIKYVDYGCYTNNNCDQVDYTKIACEAMLNNICGYGFGFCRTGQAINITANKFKSVKAALIFDEYTAEYSVRHNAANFFSIATKYINEEKLNKVLDKIIHSSFDGGRHQIRVQKIEDLSNERK